MKSLRSLFSQDDKFFDLLDASATQAQNSVALLAALVRSPDSVANLEEFTHSRRRDKRITEQITEELCKTFVTPLDREDIEGLSFALYKIPKNVERFGEKFMLCRGQVEGVDFHAQANIIEESAKTVTEMVHKLRSRADLETMKEHNEHLHHLEGQADKLMMQLNRDLYSGRHDPLRVIIMLDLCETLEGIVDRCRDAGNVVFQIVLKYS